jgi:hypothetical protein
VFVGEDERMEV